jgi:hypothetical protein
MLVQTVNRNNALLASSQHGQRRALLISWLALIPLLLLCLVPRLARAATFSASLDRDTITLGESANLSLSFSGTQSQNAPNLPPIPNLEVRYVGPSSQVSFINGQVSSSITHNFIVTPKQSGDFTIPSFQVTIGSENLSSQPLTLKVLKANAPSPQAINSGSQVAFFKLVLPRKELYVGETIPVELDLYLHARVHNIGNFQCPSFSSDGFNVGNMIFDEEHRRQAQVGNSVYNVIPIRFPLRAVKVGQFTFGPISASFVLQLVPANRQRDIMDPFGFFGERYEQKQVTIATDPETLQALPLPRESAPAGFNGAVGSYTMTVTAGPTNVVAGDPITVKIQISGRGAVDALSLPEQSGWTDFKTYPPTTKVEMADALGLQGTKSFEQIVVPQSPDIKELPPISFSFFDPERKSYQTLNQPATPLIVRAGGATVAPSFLANGSTRQDTPAPTQDIVPNKQHVGTLAQVRPPLVLQPWFVALQGVPMLAFFSALVWRKRTDSLANNPRLRRQRQVAHLVREGLGQLRGFAAQNKSDDFFATLFHLLQEQLGERLDVPASAITEAVIEEHLRPQKVPDTVLNPLHELFQTCNLARYAPIKSSQELAALVPKVEGLLREIQGLKL